jgi:uncharacterized protein (TIGR00304 family)
MRPWLLAVGFVIVLVGVLVIASSASGSTVSTGGFVLLGPIPIVFGSGEDGQFLSALAIVLGLLMLALVYFTSRRIRSDETEH